MNSVLLLAGMALAGLAGCAAAPEERSGSTQARDASTASAPATAKARSRGPIQPSPMTFPAEVQPPHRSPGDKVEPAPSSQPGKNPS